MKRNEFIKTCGWGCFGIMTGISGLSSCTGTRYFPASIDGNFMIVPLDAFVNPNNDQSSYRQSVIAHHQSLQYPIAVFRESETSYQALWMRCTHQGTELQVFGDRLQCPAHGSEFTSSGKTARQTIPCVLFRFRLKQTT